MDRARSQRGLRTGIWQHGMFPPPYDTIVMNFNEILTNFLRAINPARLRWNYWDTDMSKNTVVHPLTLGKLCDPYTREYELLQSVLHTTVLLTLGTKTSNPYTDSTMHCRTFGLLQYVTFVIPHMWRCKYTTYMGIRILGKGEAGTGIHVDNR